MSQSINSRMYVKLSPPTPCPAVMLPPKAPTRRTSPASRVGRGFTKILLVNVLNLHHRTAFVVYYITSFVLEGGLDGVSQ